MKKNLTTFQKDLEDSNIKLNQEYSGVLSSLYCDLKELIQVLLENLEDPTISDLEKHES
jgi:hypothetical protein